MQCVHVDGRMQNFVAVSVSLALWYSGQSSWLQIQRSWFVSRRYQIFWEEVCLERGPLILVSTIEELLERKSSGFGLENRDYGRRRSAALTARHPSIRKSWHFTDKRRSLGWYSSLSDSGHGVCFALRGCAATDIFWYSKATSSPFHPLSSIVLVGCLFCHANFALLSSPLLKCPVIIISGNISSVIRWTSPYQHIRFFL
jgi:hypothetical protein